MSQVPHLTQNQMRAMALSQGDYDYGYGHGNEEQIPSKEEQEARKKKGLCRFCGEKNDQQHTKGVFVWVTVGKNRCLTDSICRPCYQKRNLSQARTVDDLSLTSSRPNKAGLPPKQVSPGVRLEPSVPFNGRNDSSATSRTETMSFHDSDSILGVGSQQSGGATDSLRSTCTGSSNLSYQSGGGTKYAVSQYTATSTASLNSSSRSGTLGGSSDLASLPSEFMRSEDELGPPKPPGSFLPPKIYKGIRDVQVKVHDWTNTGSQMEKIYLTRNVSKAPQVYRKLPYPRPVPLGCMAGHMIFCLTLPRHESQGYQEPPPDSQYELVAIKKFSKKRRHGLCEGESPFKEARVLQQLGHSDKGVLECKEVLEDERYIYVVCKLTRYRTLGAISMQPPAWQPLPLVPSLPSLRNGSKETQAQTMFRDILDAVQRLHAHGICHRSLSPTTVLLEPPDARRNRAKKSKDESNNKIFVDDYTMSLQVPTSREHARHWITQQGHCGRKDCMAPEVYFNQVFDGFAADIWSLGVILFHLLTDNHPLYHLPSRQDRQYEYFILYGGIADSVAGEALMEQLFAQNSDKLSPLFEIIDDLENISPDARELLSSMLREDPKQRKTVEELLQHKWLRKRRYY
jgi:serine/threonine protein kinase